MNNLIYPEERYLRSDYFDNLGDVFNGFFRTPLTHRSVRKARIPAVDVAETDTAYQVKAELPGIRKEDLDVTVDDGVLTIKAEHNDNQEQTKNGQLICQERSYGTFARSLRLGANVDEETITAEYRDGVLHITLPKAKEVQPRKVEVSVV
jgi:HSP20 family protein